MDRKVVIMDHPLIQHKLSILRDVDTSTMEFRELVNEIAMLMMYDATRDLPLEDKQVTTPCGVADCKVLAGGSAIDAIGQIKKRHPRSVKFLCIIAAPEGLEALKKAHPDVDIFCAGMDDHLNENGYIVPGLGDAGDRIFGTK